MGISSLVIVNIFLLLYIFITYFLAFGKANHEYARVCCFIVVNAVVVNQVHIIDNLKDIVCV
jgi:hypothetical protein